MMNEKKLMKLVHSKKIYIYGAGKNASKIFQYAIDHDWCVAGFLVTDIEKNPSTIFGLPVISALKYKNMDGEIILCSIVYGISNSIAYKEVLQQTLSLGWNNVVFFSKNTFQTIYTWEQRRLRNSILKMDKQGSYYIDAESPVEARHSVLVMDNGHGKYCWRVENTSLKDVFLELKNSANKSLLREFEEQFGTYLSWQDMGCQQNIDCNVNLAVYMTRSVMDHNIFCHNMPSWVTPIQVGASLTDRKICQLCDDQGDNISERNQIYSEVTAIYWMWKHAPSCDYIGLFHYRRHIDITDEDVSKLKDIDVLVTLPTFVPENIGKMFPRFVPEMDLIQLFKAIKTVAPEYYKAARLFFEARFYPPCNLFIMKREVFNRYAKFLFAVTFRIEDYYRKRNIFRSDRYMGYLVECLMGIFLMHNKDHYRIAYSNMLFYER